MKEVGLTTLLHRRNCSDMLETFKILKGIDDVDYRTWFARVHELHQKTRQAVTVSADGKCWYSDNIAVPKAKLDVRKNFFSVRVVEKWNNLPISVRKAANVDQFKQEFDKHFDGK